MTLLKEISENFSNFSSSWKDEALKNLDLTKSSDRFFISYKRISAIQALKVDLLNDVYSKESIAFFHEAHNDLLVSHVSAAFGAWRAALQSLRSFIENTLCAIYYTDHPIELRNWELGKKKIGFSELTAYIEGHPDFVSVSNSIDGLLSIKNEYKTLSVAVHGSAKNFRMTDDISKILLWNTNKDVINKWSAREAQSIGGIILVLINMHRAKLNGTQRSGVRQALSFVFGPGLRAHIKKELKITINDP